MKKNWFRIERIPVWGMRCRFLWRSPRAPRRSAPDRTSRARGAPCARCSRLGVQVRAEREQWRTHSYDPKAIGWDLPILVSRWRSPARVDAASVTETSLASTRNQDSALWGLREDYCGTDCSVDENATSSYPVPIALLAEDSGEKSFVMDEKQVEIAVHSSRKYFLP